MWAIGRDRAETTDSSLGSPDRDDDLAQLILPIGFWRQANFRTGASIRHGFGGLERPQRLAALPSSRRLVLPGDRPIHFTRYGEAAVRGPTGRDGVCRPRCVS